MIGDFINFQKIILQHYMYIQFLFATPDSDAIDSK